MEIFFVELLKFGPEYFGEDMIDLGEVAELNHTIGLIDDEIFEVFEVEYLIFEEFVDSARCTDYYVGFTLADDSELFLF